MYEDYFGLSKKPFDLCPDPTIVFDSDIHKEALAVLRYGVLERKGFLLLTGDVGTGKTTLLQVLINSLTDKAHICLIANPKIDVDEFYYYMAKKFNLDGCENNKSKFILDFSNFLKKCHAKKERVILVVDEAHVLPIDILEEIRLLSNQEYKEYGIMSIFLVGQPELNERLAGPRLLPLRQRIGIRYHLDAFSEENTKRYILFRLKKAGGENFNIFSGEALKLIHEHTEGVPRLINTVCDQAMLLGYAENVPVISAKMIRQCVDELKAPGQKEALPLPEKKSKFDDLNQFFLQSAASISFVATLLFILMFLGQVYWLIAPLTWPAHQSVAEIHDLILTKGESLWEQFLKL